MEGRLVEMFVRVDPNLFLRKMEVRYLRATTELRLTRQAVKLPRINWYVDASFSVNPKGKAILYFCCPWVLELSTISSTKAELIGLNDAPCWSRAKDRPAARTAQEPQNTVQV